MRRLTSLFEFRLTLDTNTVATDGISAQDHTAETVAPICIFFSSLFRTESGRMVISFALGPTANEPGRRIGSRAEI
jgi:hypothetical protein